MNRRSPAANFITRSGSAKIIVREAAAVIFRLLREA